MTPPNQQDVAALVARLKPVWQIIDAFMTVTGNDHLLRSDAIKALREAATALSTLAAELKTTHKARAEAMSEWTMAEDDANALRSSLTASEGRATALEAQLARAREALKPFADLGVGSGPDDEHDNQPYRILRGAIRRARSVLEG